MDVSGRESRAACAQRILDELDCQANQGTSRTPRADVQSFALQLWIAPGGNDTQSGAQSAPLATLEGARDRLRRLRAEGRKGAALIRIEPGEYKREKTFTLGEQDSGTAGEPVVFRAVKKGTALFRGGERLSGFTPVVDPALVSRLPAESRHFVMQCDLKALGITDYGELKQRGYKVTGSIPELELYFNGEAMTLARWPNHGFVADSKIFSSGSSLLSTFEYTGDRPARWIRAKDPWLFGYFRESWAHMTVPVGSIDPSGRHLTTKVPYMDSTGIDIPAYPSIEVKHGIRYYVFNLLEEIDQPGEWYLDRDSGILYFYPPSDPDKAVIELSMLAAPMVVFEKVSHVRFEGLSFELARHDGVTIRGGQNCLLAGCGIGRLGGGAVLMDGGFGHGLLGCDLFTLGRNGTWISGGDRQTLTPCGHFAENCHIHDFSRLDRTYSPAVNADGVGTRIAHNLIHHSPGHAIRLGGNDHLVEFNEFHSVVRESDDQGAIDMFGNPTFRGCVFRYNYFHHIGGLDDKPRAGIRFDDAISGMVVYGNVFFRSAQGHFGAVQVNSGRENIVVNNIVADCKQGFSGGWTPGWSEHNTFWEMFGRHEQPEWTDYIMSDLYLARYPMLRDLVDKPPLNFLWHNVLWNSGITTTMNPAHTDMVDMRVHDCGNPGFVAPEAGNFRLKADAPLLQSPGFRPIPVDEIGLYEDAARATWPVTSTPEDVRDWRQKG